MSDYSDYDSDSFGNDCNSDDDVITHLDVLTNFRCRDAFDFFINSPNLARLIMRKNVEMNNIMIETFDNIFKCPIGGVFDGIFASSYTSDFDHLHPQDVEDYIVWVLYFELRFRARPFDVKNYNDEWTLRYHPWFSNNLDVRIPPQFVSVENTLVWCKILRGIDLIYSEYIGVPRPCPSFLQFESWISICHASSYYNFSNSLDTGFLIFERYEDYLSTFGLVRDVDYEFGHSAIFRLYWFIGNDVKDLNFYCKYATSSYFDEISSFKFTDSKCAKRICPMTDFLQFTRILWFHVITLLVDIPGHDSRGCRLSYDFKSMRDYISSLDYTSDNISMLIEHFDVLLDAWMMNMQFISETSLEERCQCWDRNYISFCDFDLEPVRQAFLRINPGEVIWQREHFTEEERVEIWNNWPCAYTIHSVYDIL
jgi:hypothetical protein